jgi:membrane fusion protein (multidrug efflux system)
MSAPGDRRSRLRPALLGAAAALFIVGTALFVLAPDPDRVATAEEGTMLPQVETHLVRAELVRSRIEIAGVLEARRSVQLFAETRGPVVQVGAEELDRVVHNQLLLQIDPLLAEVAVERAEAAVARGESELALAQSNLARVGTLAERGVASSSALEDAENAEKVAAAALREARAERVRARDDLAKKTIGAPFNGVLRSFPVEVGEYVHAGEQLGELLDLDTARTTIGLSDQEVVAVRAGQDARVLIEAYPDEVFEGRVLRVGAASDTVTKKFPVEVEVPNPDRRLLPGMVARVVLDLGEGRPRTVIPRDATVDEYGLRFVWVVAPADGGSGRVVQQRRIAVRPVPFRPGEYEVISGLSEGEEIAVTRIRRLREGERVAPKGNEAS